MSHDSSSFPFRDALKRERETASGGSGENGCGSEDGERGGDGKKESSGHRGNDASSYVRMSVSRSDLVPKLCNSQSAESGRGTTCRPPYCCSESLRCHAV